MLSPLHHRSPVPTPRHPARDARAHAHARNARPFPRGFRCAHPRLPSRTPAGVLGLDGPWIAVVRILTPVIPRNRRFRQGCRRNFARPRYGSRASARDDGCCGGGPAVAAPHDVGATAPAIESRYAQTYRRVLRPPVGPSTNAATTAMLPWHGIDPASAHRVLHFFSEKHPTTHASGAPP